ncbi:MAG: succinylglutamate desuccinylase/aspartoacylase family protein [Pseudomonadota bacterium]
MDVGTALGRFNMTLDLAAPGRHAGDLRVKYSDNINPLGFITVPIWSVKGQTGPTVLILGGVHGDEFEGPAAVLRLCQTLDPPTLTGQVILIPALNFPAVMASSRVSPQDGANLNRAFPGDPDGGPSAMIAHMVETALLPHVEAVIDLHSGGKASVFAPCALATRTGDPDLFAGNLGLAEAFGMPTTWVLSALNDNRSVNAAAERVGVPMIAAELGGGGGVEPDLVGAAEAGLMRCLASLGIVDPQPSTPAVSRQIEVTSPDQTVMAPGRGIFDRLVRAGDTVTKDQPIGWLRFIDELARPPLAIVAPEPGFVLAHTNRGLVERGELLVQLATEISGNA